MAVRYLTADEVLALAEDSMRSLGYASRSSERTDAASWSRVARAQMVGYYGEADLVAPAAALANGITLNHPFIDGNKCAALAACVTFLDANGLALPASALRPLAEQLIAQHDLTDRAQADAMVADWLRGHLT